MSVTSTSIRSPSGVPGSASHKRSTSFKAARWSAFVLIGRMSMAWYSLHCHSVDLVIVLMRANESHIDPLAAIVDCGNEPILVPADIEDRSTIGKNIGAAERLLDIGRLRPIGCLHDMHPHPQRLFRIAPAWAAPEFPQRAHRDDPHESRPSIPAPTKKAIMFSFWEQGERVGYGANGLNATRDPVRNPG